MLVGRKIGVVYDYLQLRLNGFDWHLFDVLLFLIMLLLSYH